MPTTVPAEDPGDLTSFGEKKCSAINNRAMRDVIGIMNKESEFKWLLQCAESGEIVSLQRSEGPEPRSEWGNVEKIGTQSNHLQLPVVRRTAYGGSVAEFWLLPDDLGGDLTVPRAVAQTEGQKIPNLRYADAPRLPAPQSDSKRRTASPQRGKRISKGVETQKVKRTKRTRTRSKKNQNSSESECDEEESDDDAADPDYEPPNRVMQTRTRVQEEKSEAPTWGAPFSQCQVGKYAVVLFTDEHPVAPRTYLRQGIQVVKITAVHDNERSFTARGLTCTATTTMQACLTAQWNLISSVDETGERRDKEVIHGTETAAVYFSALKTDKTLPVVVRKALDSVPFRN
jgi:hypothetical protein